MTILTGCLLLANTLFAFTRQDTLRGSNGTARAWWDVQHYAISFTIDTAEKSINGSNMITFKPLEKANDSMQIDLQYPMLLDSAILNNKIFLDLTREGNVYWITGLSKQIRDTREATLSLYFHGIPREAVKAPWDGGFIRTKDSLGHPWIAVACQGLGASSWWPCKDYQGDEPDKGASVTVNFNRGLRLISNGKERATGADTGKGQENQRSSWEVRNPINTYDVTFYLGAYTSWADTFKGAKGILELSFNALRYNEQKAREQFKQVKKMLEAFEYWFGPYPFYEDGYKIVEAPFLGMEHQSAIAYGNQYRQGYQGKDRSGTGVGLLFDFIIVHESGHEWFGNSITAEDIADNWIHEGFTTYSETLFAEYWFGKEKAFEYTRGEWKNCSNDRPVTGQYGVQDEGSSDKYDKGSALIHTIRLLMKDDALFRAMLHKMNDTFYHKQVTGTQVENFLSAYSGLALTPLFNQYLRSTMIPELQWKQKGRSLEYRFVTIADGFELPVPVFINGQEQKLLVNKSWQTLPLSKSSSMISFPPTFLLRIKQL